MWAKPNPNSPGFAGLRLGLAIVGRAKYAQMHSREACTAQVHRRDVSPSSEWQKRTARQDAQTKHVSPNSKALVYDILPSTAVVFSYAILGSRKLSANEQLFAGAQTVVSLLQTSQIKQSVSFIATNKVYTSTNKTTIVWIETEHFFLPWVDASHVYDRALALGCFCIPISTRRLTAARR